MKTILEKIKSIHWADRRIIMVVVIVVLVLLMMDFNNRMVNMLQLGRQEKQLNTQVAALQQTKVKIEAQIAYATSDAAVEQWAREENRLVNEGDYPIIIMAPSGQIPTPTPRPVTAKVMLSNMQIWKELLFGGN
ncbi:MAG TPA: septum formation initiator family protein [Anaerolineaceae bacterium]|jgi:cell division protein FtsB|nr:septum formation initiator family protein [Anaerolineaceae bacterium]HPT23354.1 septum formation initiator family protein [Anaerolineaceae bacterium]